MDGSLTYDEHVTQVTSKCIGSLCQINRVRYLFDRSTLITRINSLVFSKLLYCSSVWARDHQGERVNPPYRPSN